MTFESDHEYHTYEVIRYFQHGVFHYEETCYCRGTTRALEEYIRGEFERFLGDESKRKIAWTFEEQDALEGECGVSCGERSLEISAREIDSLDDLYVARL